MQPQSQHIIRALVDQGRQRLQPEAAQVPLGELARALLGAAPGAGDVMAAQDSQRAGQVMAQALAGGDYGQAASSGLESLAHALGALPMVPAFGGVLSSTRLRRGVGKLTEDAKSQEAWRDWYDRHQAVVADTFKEEAPLFQELLSATSQATGVKGNVTLALKAYQQLKNGEPFTGFLPAVIKNLERIRGKTAVSGAKIARFAEANTGSAEAIPVDRHISMLMFNTKSPTPRQITKAQETIKVVSKKLGWQPRETQAALWAANQVRLGADPSKVQSYDSVIVAQKEMIKHLLEGGATK